MDNPSRRNLAAEYIEDRFLSVAKQYNSIKNYICGSFSKADSLKEALMGILTAVYTFVIASAEIPLEIYPFGFALIAVSGRMSLFALFGACMGACFYRNYAVSYIVLYIALFCSLKLLKQKNISLVSKVFLCGLCSALSGIYQYISQGFLSIDILRTFCNLSISSLSAFVFSGIFERDMHIAKKNFAHLEISVCALVTLFLFSIRDFYFFGLSLGFVIAGQFTLLCAKAGGALYGACAGMLCGLAAGDSQFAVIWGIAGLVSGMWFVKNSALALILASLSSVGLSVYFKGFDAVYSGAPEGVISTILFMTYCSKIPDGILVGYRFSPREKRPEDLSSKKFGKLSRALSSLSQVFFKLSDKMHYPDDYEVRNLIKRTISENCEKCSMSSMCIVKDKSDSEQLYNIIYEALCEGGLAKSDLPDGFASGCERADFIISHLNALYREKATKYFSDNKAEILACEYSAMARMIKYTSDSSISDTRRDKILEENAKAALSAIDVDFTSVRAYGKRNKVLEVYGVTIDKIPVNARDLAVYMSDNCKILLSEPEFVIEDDCFVMKMYCRKKIDVEYSQATRAKNGNSINGDTVSFFENDDGYFYALISDGMGSGRQAALTSRLTGLFMEKLLTTGAHKSVTLELLNNMLLAKNDETFATVDLLEIDMLNSKASFVKAGAAPAYVIRSSKLYKIASATPPAGIIKCFSAENTKFSLQDGDIILMLSDGIIQSFDDSPWLAEMIKFDTDEDVCVLANNILEKALAINTRDDDMSVVAARIISAEI